MIQLLAISGSLRSGSSNTAVLRAAAALAPDDVTVTLYEQLGELPPFNPDLDASSLSPPTAVATFRRLLKDAGCVLISSPEYAHGVPGVMKNALDWIVSSGEFMGKPVGLITTSAHARHAPAQLAETLSVMMAVVVAGASPTVPLSRNAIDPAAIVADAEHADAVRDAVAALAREVRSRTSSSGL
ncbi:MAG: NADPH-dependent reductase [Phycisphaerales bacterium]|nr:NADPH-dependent reductase [Phycisphaerales bacterium]